MTPLRRRFIDDLTLRNLSPRTIQCYVWHVAHFARHFGRSPEELTDEHVREYQLHLLHEQKASWSRFNQAVCALRFLYGTTLGRPEYLPRLPYGKRPRKLPLVLSQDEVLELLRCTSRPAHRMVLMTMYATGLRVSEAVALRPADIDSRRMAILVAQGKGNKQRLVPLSQKLLSELRLWWRVHRHPQWLFPGQKEGQPLCVTGIQRAVGQAARRAGLTRRPTTHTLRHTFATQLLEAGIDLLTIQKILGHNSLETTARYTHVRRSHLLAAAGVLDLLPLDQLWSSQQQTGEPSPRRSKEDRKSPKSSAATARRSSRPTQGG
jgi:site-specific recombinase XerD